MNTKLRIIALVGALLCAVGCSRQSEGKLQLQAKRSISVYNEVELDKLILLGMSAAEVTNKFGPPGSATEINKGIILLTYSFPLAPEKGALHLAGFNIYIKDGAVDKWSPMMEESRKNVKGGSVSQFGEQSFQLFVATDEITNLVNSIEMEGSADATRVKVSPDLAFKAKVFAGSSGTERPGEQTVLLVISDEDAQKLKALTGKMFGKRLLIVCRNKVIAVPVVSVPLAAKQFMFTVKNSHVLDSMRGQ